MGVNEGGGGKHAWPTILGAKDKFGPTCAVFMHTYLATIILGVAVKICCRVGLFLGIYSPAPSEAEVSKMRWRSFAWTGVAVHVFVPSTLICQGENEGTAVIGDASMGDDMWLP